MLTEIMPSVSGALPSRPRRLSSVFFWVRSMPESIRFYRDVMGFSLVYQEPRFATMKAGDIQISFQESREKEQPALAAPAMVLTVEVDSVWSFFRQLQDRSVSASEPRTQDWDRSILFTEFQDLNGVRWALVEPLR